MTTQIYLAIILAHVNFASYADDRSKDKPSAAAADVETDTPLVERIAALKLQLEAREKALSSELAAARKVDSKARSKTINEVIEDFHRDEQAIADKVSALVRTHPTDPAAFEGILLLRASFDDDLLAIVRAHFMNDARMGQLCASLAHRMKDSSKGLLRDIGTKSLDRQIRGQATYSLGLYSRSLYGQMIAGRKLTLSEHEQLLAETQRYFD